MDKQNSDAFMKEFNNGILGVDYKNPTKSISVNTMKNLLSGIKLKDIDNQSAQCTQTTKDDKCASNMHVTHCIKCGADIIMTDADRNWYINKGLKIPKHCKECIAVKKLLNTNHPNKIINNEDNKSINVFHFGDIVSTFKCIECNNTFEISESHKKWFIDKGLVIPTRCPSCISRRKAEKAAQ